MALLAELRKLPALTLAAALLLVVASGCMVLESLGLIDPEPSFSHALHADLGVECMDCHGVEGSDEPTWPEEVTCALCHDDIDPDKDPERRASALFVDGVLASAAAEPPDDIVFSHEVHGEAGLDCSDCHGDVATSEAIDDSMMPVMDDCLFCHGDDPGADGEADNCSLCHEEIRRDRMPPNHDRQWMRMHGLTARADTGATAADCSLCHRQDSCTECHRTTMPANHNNTWRLRTHGLVAAMNRDNCATCHQADSCNRCHEETLPLSHTGSFGSPKSTHCFSCHFPLQQESCIVCHKGTPSHLEAAPKPPDHSPGLNCRQCHGVDVALPHVDAGLDCNICHL